MPTGEMVCGFAVLDKGFVRLVDQMGTDDDIISMARVSYNSQGKSLEEDYRLLRYLYRNSHTSPFERVEFVFHAKMPIFVARQWIRHRTASVNEYSMRYSEAIDDMYVPDALHQQSKTNKQGSGELISESDALLRRIKEHGDNALSLYKELRDAGVSREISRIVIPVAGYTEWYWKIDLKNLLHFIGLRSDGHAQHEIRVYSDAMLKLITPYVPNTVEAFNDFHPMRDAILFSKQEVSILRRMMSGEKYNQSEITKTEWTEFQHKLLKMKDTV